MQPRSPLRRAGVAGETSDQARVINYTFSTPDIGRDGHRILADAWQTGSFLRNPVFLWSHLTTEPPIGRVFNLRTVGNALKGSVQYADYPFADTIYALARDGYLNATSVSFLPLPGGWRYPSEKGRDAGAVDFTKVELLEISQVPVPALPAALADARSAGIDVWPLGEWAEQALDSNASPLARGELEAIRRAVGMQSTTVYTTPRVPMVRSASAARAARLPAEARASAPRFRSFGENLIAVWRASTGQGVDPRLVRAATGANEADPTAGGFMVETQYAQELVSIAYEQSELASLCDRRPTDFPLAEVRIPGIDETSRADGSRWGGAFAYWSAEGSQAPRSLPRFKNLSFGARKLIAIAYGTGELMADVPMFDAHMRRVFGAEMSFKLDLAVIAGAGAGVPLGILNSPARITAPKVTGQAAATLVSQNISDMWKRLPAPSRRRAVWLVHEDVESMLDNLYVEVGAGGGAAPLYLPAGVNGNELPLLKGRPVIALEQCPVPGAEGDIILADLGHYIIIDGGVRPALSADLMFDSDEVIWRFVLRTDGKPAFSSPITPYTGSTTRSPFVTLAAR